MREILTFVFLLTVCAQAGADRPSNLADARERWALVGPESYSFTIREVCFLCGEGEHGPAQIMVRRGKLRQATYIGKTNGAFMWGQHFRPKSGTLRATVPALFELIEGAISRGSEGVEVDYDRTDGHPKSIRFAGGFEDDFLNIEVTNFVEK